MNKHHAIVYNKRTNIQGGQKTEHACLRGYNCMPLFGAERLNLDTILPCISVPWSMNSTQYIHHLPVHTLLKVNDVYQYPFVEFYTIRLIMFKLFL